MRRQFVWLPSKTKFPVVIVELVSVTPVSSLLPSFSEFFPLPIRGKRIFVNFHIFWVLMACSRLFLSKRISLRALYILAISRAVDAKLIISTIDNNSWGNLFKYSDLRIISLQNGIRCNKDYSDISEQDIYIGLATKKPQNLRARKYVGLGSLSIASLKPTDQLKRSHKGKTVVLVSQFRSHLSGSTLHDLQIVLAKWTAHYAREKGLLFKIALNSRESALTGPEIEYFQSTGLNFNYSEKSHPNMSIQDVSDSALTVGLSSTLLVEALALGIPTLICHQLGLPRGENGDWAFESVDKNFLLPARADFVTFCDFADRLLNLNQESLARKVIQHRMDVCALEIGDGYSKTLEKIVLEILAHQKSDKEKIKLK